MDKEQKSFRNNVRRRKKVCAFCAEKVEYIDFKNADKLKKYVSERGKILPRRVMGTCAKHQRELTTAIKRARQVALLPYDAEVTRLAKAKHFAYSKPEAVKVEENEALENEVETVVETVEEPVVEEVAEAAEEAVEEKTEE
ncbi:MAG: 30S ribosomal protein S18 [Clostridia bacterium]|jgi:small subunit ribosomal protein S18|nr:30S ribosomal protein S18 [Clostridia bacterium]